MTEEIRNYYQQELKKRNVRLLVNKKFESKEEVDKYMKFLDKLQEHHNEAFKEIDVLEKLPYFVNAFGRIGVDGYCLSALSKTELESLLFQANNLRKQLLELVPYEVFHESKIEILQAYESLNDLIWLKSQDIEDVLEEMDA